MMRPDLKTAHESLQASPQKAHKHSDVQIGKKKMKRKNSDADLREGNKVRKVSGAEAQPVKSKYKNIANAQAAKQNRQAYKVVQFRDDEDDEEYRPRGKNMKAKGKQPVKELVATFDGPRPAQRDLDERALKLREERKRLPIWAHQADLRFALRYRADVLVVVAETGSGKSTQIPQFLMREPWMKPQKVWVKEGNEMKEVLVGGKIAVTEPRRLAAISLANRVSQEAGCHLGKNSDENDLVGYQVRFESCLPKKHKIKYMTEGMLLQELLRDPYLRRYSCVIIDEIHERSVDVDLLAGFIKNIVTGDLKERGGVPLKVVVMSATADVERIHGFFATPGKPLAEPNLVIKKPADANSASESESSKDSSSSPSPVESSQASSWNGIEDDSKDATTKSTSSEDEAPADDSAPKKRRGSDAELNNLDIDVVKNNVHLYHPDDNVFDLFIKGRQHFVEEIHLTKPVADVLHSCLTTIFIVHTQEAMPGDILVFLTGQEEIQSLAKSITETAANLKKELPQIEVVKLYGQMDIAEQQKAFAKTKAKNTRKVILSTNIAETSVTVPGVRYVIDSGRAKVKEYRPHLGLASLLIKPISQSSAIQRKGRAGREMSGKCWRLYSTAEFAKLKEADRPEILRSDVVDSVLKMKSRGIDDIFSFPLMDAPPKDTMYKALIHLLEIGALNGYGQISDIGRKMSYFPLPPDMSRVLLAAADPSADCLLEAVDAISVLQGDDIFESAKEEEERLAAEEARKDLVRREGDIITALTAMQKYALETSRKQWCKQHLISIKNMEQAFNVRRQLLQLCVQQKLLTKEAVAEAKDSEFAPLDPERAETLIKCFLRAYASKTATIQTDGRYQMVKGKHIISVHPSSVLHGKRREAIMFLEHVYTQKNYAKRVTSIQADWIDEALAQNLQMHQGSNQ
jgi:ATP-dependent RNA helicase DHR2